MLVFGKHLFSQLYSLIGWNIRGGVRRALLDKGLGLNWRNLTRLLVILLLGWVSHRWLLIVLLLMHLGMVYRRLLLVKRLNWLNLGLKLRLEMIGRLLGILLLRLVLLHRVEGTLCLVMRSTLLVVVWHCLWLLSHRGGLTRLCG
jgi:hypothetical protein